MSFRLLATSTVVMGAALLGACGDNGKCDPNQILDQRVCIPRPEAGVDVEPPPEMPDADTIDGETPDGATVDAAAETSTPVGMFGKSCTMAGDSPECTPPAPYCAVKPGDTMGYCTVTGCTANPALCPMGWSCFDVGVVNFCLKPTSP